MENSQFRKLNIKCQNHGYTNATYFTLRSDKNQQIYIEYLCSICALQQSISDQKIFLIIQELANLTNETIITNWPPLKDKQLMERFTNIYDDILSNMQTRTKEKQIKEYFKKVKHNILNIIDAIEEQKLLTLSSIRITDLMAVYNHVSQKNNLYRSMQNDKYNENFFIEAVYNVYQKQDPNHKMLEIIVKEYEYLQKQTDLDSIKLIFNPIYSMLNEYLQQQQQINQLSEKNQENKKVSNQDYQLNLLNKQYVKCVQQLPSFIKNQDKYSFMVQSNQIQEQIDAIIASFSSSILSQKIQDSLNEKKVISNKNTLSIDRNRIRNTNGNQYGYIDTEITCEDIGKSFGIQIKNLVHWIGIGIIDKVKLIKNSFQSKGDFHEKICYFISHNGYSWSLLKESQYKKQISFQFKTNDVLVITILSSEILFQNKTTQQEFRMDFQFQKGKKYFPGFRLFDVNDEIEFI